MMTNFQTRRSLLKLSLSSDTSLTTRINLDPDLCFGTMNTALDTLSKYRRGNATAGHVAQAASAIRLLSTHISQSGLDEALMEAVPNLATGSQAIGIDPTSLSNFIAYAKKLDPTFQASDVSGVAATSPEAFKENAPVLAKAGVSGMLHHAADMLQDYSVRKAATSAQPSLAMVLPAVYLPDNQAAHLQRTQQNSCSPLNCLIVHCAPPSWCSAAGISWTALTSAVGGIVQQCSDNAATFAFCSALSSEVAALGISVASTITWSVIAVGLLLLIICT
jgi:hypothetical protein